MLYVLACFKMQENLAFPVPTVIVAAIFETPLHSVLELLCMCFVFMKVQYGETKLGRIEGHFYTV